MANSESRTIAQLRSALEERGVVIQGKASKARLLELLTQKERDDGEMPNTNRTRGGKSKMAAKPRGPKRKREKKSSATTLEGSYIEIPKQKEDEGHLGQAFACLSKKKLTRW